jgi:hypothetical protein
MKTICFTAFLVLLTFFNLSHAQKNFVEGYVVTLSHDTIKGYIDYREWRKNPKSISFRDSSGSIIIYYPGSITGFFRTSEEIYLSRTVSMDLTPFLLSDLIMNPGTILVKDTNVFLQVLVYGDVSLFYFIDRNEKRHFYMGKSRDSVFELRTERKVITPAGQAGYPSSSMYLAENPLYRLYLPGILNECPSLEKKIENVHLSVPTLKKLVENYNACVSPGKSLVTSAKKPVKIKPGFIAGGSVVCLRFPGQEGSDLSEPSFVTGYTYDPCYTYSAGVSLSIVFPWLRSSWILYNDLIYRSYKTESNTTTEYIGYLVLTEYSRYSFDMSYIKLNTLIKYRYPGWKVSPFIYLGMSNGYCIKADITKHITRVQNNKIILEEDPLRLMISAVIKPAWLPVLVYHIPFSDWNSGMNMQMPSAIRLLLSERKTPVPCC